MTVLVTGATGLIGNNVVRRLLADGQEVRVFLRHSSDPRPLADLEVERSAMCASLPMLRRPWRESTP